MAKDYRFLKLDPTQVSGLIAFREQMIIKMDQPGFTRAQAVYLSHQGWTVPEIAGQLKHSECSVYRWLGSYQKFGLDGLVPKSRPGKLSSEQVNQIIKISGRENAFKRKKDLHKVWSSRKIAQWIKDNWNIKISHKRIWQIFRKKMIE
jgi:transposase